MDRGQLYDAQRQLDALILIKASGKFEDALESERVRLSRLHGEDVRAMSKGIAKFVESWHMNNAPTIYVNEEVHPDKLPVIGIPFALPYTVN